MNGNGVVGLDSSPIGAGPGSERVKRKLVVETTGNGVNVMPRSKVLRSAYSRKRSIKRVSMLVVCAAAIVLVSAVAMVALDRTSQMRAGIRALPVASFTISVNSASVTVDGSASTGDSTLYYLWNWGDNVTQGGVRATHFYFKTLDYTISLTVIDTIGQTGTHSQVQHVVNNGVPPLPYTVYGYTFASDGVTALPGSTVVITDLRTNMTLINQPVSDSSGFYSADIMPLMNGTSPINLDHLILNATGPSGEKGTNTGIVDTSLPYVNIDVTLSSVVIPEFGFIAIPIVGMIAIIAMARVASNKGGEE